MAPLQATCAANHAPTGAMAVSVDWSACSRREHDRDLVNLVSSAVLRTALAGPLDLL